MRFFHNGYQRGILLPTAAIFSVVGMLTTMSYMSYALNKKINLDHRIANTKALYNAESGLALSYQWLSSSNWESDYDSTTFQGNHSINSSMGSYENVILYKSINDITKRIERTSEATGLAVVKNIWGNSKIVRATAEMQFALESLSEYMYLSNHERGGGAPGIYSNWERTQPCFGLDDVLGNETEIAGQLQTMEPMRMCTTPPQFQNTIFVTIADEAFVGDDESNICDDELGVEIFPFNGETCGNSRVETCGGILNGESGPEGHECWEAKTKVCFPLQGYHSTVGAASSEHTYDATEMLYNSKSGSDFSTLKDTLIMTDIEFLENGGYQVKRWWYLLPPYLKSDIMTCGDFPGMPAQSPSIIDCQFYGTMAFGFNIQDGKNDLLYPQPFHLEGVVIAENPVEVAVMENHCTDYDHGSHEGDIRQCEQYTNPLADFHTIEYNPFTEDESFITNGWVGGGSYNNNPGGGILRFSHYDIENFSQYYVDRANDWQDPENLPNAGYWELDYVDGGQLIQDEFVSADEAVIHIRGGPVRIHGKYDGRFTVVTSGFDVVGGNDDAGYDGWSTYKRHAWNLDHGPTPVDTVRSNIWITDNITNSETGACPWGVSGICPAQPSIITANTPNAECEVWEYEKPGDCGASNNVMGLVSSSNIIIANSTANRNNGVDIHASLLALNESFVMHFWQNSVQNYQVAPMSDGRGVDIYGVDNADHRGIIRLWGGIIQEFRGYMMRGGIGFPYNGNNMGMDKKYNYDNNLFFPPPFYPYRNDCPVGGYDVVSMSLVKYGPIVSSE